jgi:hypothetical protein
VITILCDFCLFSSQKWRFISPCYDPIFSILNIKNGNFPPNFWAKIFLKIITSFPCLLSVEWNFAKKFAESAREQGDQIGRISANWAIVFFGQFFLKITEVAQR